MADDEVEAFLLQNKFEEYIEEFKKQKITGDVLPFLTEDILKTLIPPFGDRIKFTTSLKVKLSNLDVTPPTCPAASIPSSTSNKSSTELIDTNVEIICEAELADICSSLNSKSSDVAIESDIFPTHSASAHSSSTSSSAGGNAVNSISATLKELAVKSYRSKLEKLLLSDLDGLRILNYYKVNSKLIEEHRNNLAELVIREEFKTSVKYKISQDTLDTIAEAIVQQFPRERKAIYHVGYVNLGKKRKVCAKGKLVEKYNNKRTKLRKSGLLSPVKKKRSHPPLAYVTDLLDTDNNIQWLKENKEPFELVLEKWQATAEERDLLLNSSESTQDYFNYFPALRESKSGYKLILEDFKRKFGESADLFHLNWSLMAKKLCDLAAVKSNEDPTFKRLIRSCNIFLDDAEDKEKLKLLGLKLIPFLLPAPGTVSRKISQETASVSDVLNSKKKITVWKPSKPEVLDGTIFEIPSYGDFENKLAERKKKLTLLGVRHQPLVVTIKDNPKKAFVNVDTVTYEFISIMEAFDCAFKSFFVFNLEFPAESQAVFFFLQRQVYNFSTQTDKVFCSAEILASEL